MAIHLPCDYDAAAGKKYLSRQKCHLMAPLDELIDELHLAPDVAPVVEHLPEDLRRRHRVGQDRQEEEEDP